MVLVTERITRLQPARHRYLLALPAFFAVLLTIVPAPLAQYRPEFNISNENLDTLSPSMRQEIAGLHYLLNPFQLRQFFAFETDSLRHEFIERWWRSQDPTPETALNEMKVEHYRRVQSARKNFGWSGWPGWDHRGEVLIRHGVPQFRNKFESSVTQYGVTPPREAWHYTALDMTVVFEDFVLGGRYTYAMMSRGNLDTRRITGGINRKFNVPEGRIPKLIDADVSLLQVDMLPRPTNWWYAYLSKKQRQRINNYHSTRDHQGSTYPFNFDEKGLPFFFRISQFKGGGAVNRVEVNVELPFDPVSAAPAGGDTRFTVTAIFFDADYNELDRGSREVMVSAPAGADAGPGWIPAQLVFSLPRGYYRAAVIAEQETTGRRTAYRTAVSTEYFRVNTAISSILFCSRISSTGGSSMFNRGALETVPRPRLEYGVDTAVPVYFELYNLDVDEDGMSSYSVEYWIVPRTLRKWGLWYQRQEAGSYATSHFEGSGYGPDVPLHVFLGTDHLWPGEFEFHVKVTDSRTLFTTERMAVFHLTDKP